MSCLMVMAGGTGGHIVPALAVASILRDRGVKIIWIGNNDGLEARLVAKQNFDLEPINIKGLRKSGWQRKVMLPFALSTAIVKVVLAIFRHKPNALLGMGGFVSGPGGLAAKIMFKPLVLHEQNAVAGLTNKWLAKFTRHVLSGFPEARGIRNPVWVGNPVRKEIVNIPAPTQRLANRSGPLRVLVVGGSQGASVFNDHLPELLGRLKNLELDVWHQCGDHDSDVIGRAYLEQGIGCQVNGFIEDMAEAYAWSDIVICRAGAMTVSEICAAGVLALFVPYPFAVSDHQAINAEYMVYQRAALMFRQPQFISGAWLEKLTALCADRERMLKMAETARSLAKPDAAKTVADTCQEVMHA